jgi:hypothetical protein
MSIFNNKEDFKDRPEVYKMLTALEVAHAKQDEFSAAVLLTRLKQKNINIVAENACTEEENRLQ